MPFEKGNKLGLGRPKKEVCIPDILREIGKEPISPEDKRTKLQAWLQTVYTLAIEGESWASNFIADRTEGKAVQQIISESENTIRVEHEIVDDVSPPDQVE
jgi:hypothetical protein